MTATGRSGRQERSGRSRAAFQRALIVAVLVGLLAVAVGLDRSARDEDGGVRVSADEQGPSLPGPDALSVSWYCPEGTTTSGGRADGTVMVANVGAPAEAVVSVTTGEGGLQGMERVDVPAGGQVAVDLADVVDAPETIQADALVAGPAVVVEVFGGQAVVEHAVTRGDDLAVGPCARQPARDWYFAAGTTARGVEHVVTLLNPFGEDAVVDMSFVTEEGFEAPAGAQGLVVARRSRVAVLVHDQVRRRNQVAVHAHARAGRVVAEQSLVSDGSEVPAGVALSLGTTQLDRSSALPFGHRLEGSTEVVSVANFGEVGTEVEVTTLTGDEAGPATEAVPVAPRSVVSVGVGDNLAPGTDFAVEVRTTEDVSVVAEARAGWTEPAVPAGVATDVAIPAPARAWVFAGPDDAEADAVIAVANATDRPVSVELVAYSGGSETPRPVAERTVEAGQRAAFRLSEVDVEADQVLVVQGDGELYAERQIETASGRSISAGVPNFGR